MSERNPQLLLEDILEALNAVLEYTAGYNYDLFLKDRKTRDAVLRNIQIIGEAANRIPKNIKEQYSEIDWQRIIKSRHIIVHDYAGVDYEIVWRIIEVHLPSLRIDIQTVLNKLNY
jgi:uncharacterized protein with HEPN domain